MIEIEEIALTPPSVHDMWALRARLTGARGKWHRTNLSIRALSLFDRGSLSGLQPASDYEMVVDHDGALLVRMAPKGVIPVDLKGPPRSEHATAFEWLRTDPHVVVASPGARHVMTKRSDLHPAYVDHLARVHPLIVPLSRTVFLAELRAHLYTEHKRNGQVFVIGIGLGTPDPLDP